MAKKPRNRAAQDSTLINLRALKKRIDTLETFLSTRLSLIEVALGLRKAKRRTDSSRYVDKR